MQTNQTDQLPPDIPWVAIAVLVLILATFIFVNSNL